MEWVGLQNNLLTSIKVRVAYPLRYRLSANPSSRWLEWCSLPRHQWRKKRVTYAVYVWCIWAHRQGGLQNKGWTTNIVAIYVKSALVVLNHDYALHMLFVYTRVIFSLALASLVLFTKQDFFHPELHHQSLNKKNSNSILHFHQSMWISLQTKE